MTRPDSPRSERATFVALGDVMLPVSNDADVAPAVRAADMQSLVGDADLVFANLETTLAGTEGAIPKQPRLWTSPQLLAATLEAMGIGIVSLANNHAFDCYASGFDAVRRSLAAAGVRFFGAGHDLDAASAPAIVDVDGVRLGWLGYVDGSTEPSHVATTGSYGINPFDLARARAEIARTRRDVHHVIASLHWGVEYCHIPSPAQIAQARALIDAGATAVIGHHAHVMQGVQRYHEGVIAFGLGNALTTDLCVDSRLAIKQSRRTRSGIALRVIVDRDRLLGYEVVPYRTMRDRVNVADAYASRLFARASRRLAAGVTPERWRRVRFVEDVILRAVWKLDPRVIRSLRLDHVRKLVRNARTAADASTRA